MASSLASFLLPLLLTVAASAQQIGTTTPERHPPLTTYKCSVAGGCQALNTSVVIDSSTRWLHSISTPSQGCNVGSAPCDTAEACAANCALEGVDYSLQGIQTTGDALKLNQWRQDNTTGKWQTVSPRTYLLSPTGDTYENITLLNAELTFDVDLSNLPCGMNGALYLSEMELDGGITASKGLNKAGAPYGTGYCDAQCPSLPFINGAANTAKLGACCNEMDIWEANALATAYTPHPCMAERIRTCDNDVDCGQPKGYCDKWGCSFNAYQQGYHDFYGRGKQVDTNKKFTVVTQFVSSNNRTDGKLVDIRRLYIQDGKVIQNVQAKVGGGSVLADSVTDPYCNATATWTQERGGIAHMGEALARGMVLIFSLWADDGGYMTWLDSGNSGPCNATEGNPAEIVQHTPDASVTFSNIRWGEIGSTFKA
ncbi:glycoside hydrolase [Echria macrotheca]|uniref:Glucanase n=1 Tax=Echria macrotheca TaxID=438768 RepID=A0AAJ0B923_9PEZI|nr:glycoside hydrolase [Echria macrotheca]